MPAKRKLENGQEPISKKQKIENTTPKNDNSSNIVQLCKRPYVYCEVKRSPNDHTFDKSTK